MSRDARLAAEKQADNRPPIGGVYTIDIDDMTLAGEAIGKLSGYVLFVRGALPGERVRVRVQSTGRRYGRAELVEVIKTHPSRVEPQCKHFGECGRCSLQHVDYPEQLRMKERLLRTLLQHALPRLDLPIQPMLGMQEPWGTRHKVHFVVGTPNGEPKGPMLLGHYQAHSREVMPVEECPVHHPVANQIADRMLQVLQKERMPVYDDKSRRGILRHLIVRVSSSTQEAQSMVVLARPPAKGLPRLGDKLLESDPAIIGVHANLNDTTGPLVIGRITNRLAGEEHLIEKIGDIEFLVSPGSFFQTNAMAARLLVETVLKLIPNDGQPILDLYAGVGLFSLSLAKRGHRVTAVEENPHAVADGNRNVARNQIHGCRFLQGKTETLLKRVSKEGNFETVVLDPPREGCPEWALEWIAGRIGPKRIVDVSCEPNGLARDLEILTRRGYRVRMIQPIDMFPQTTHIETVALLERVGDGASDGDPKRRFRPRRPAPRSFR